MNLRQFNRRLAQIRSQLAVKSVRYNGKTVDTDANMQTMLGVLRTIPGLRTTGSCGGHKKRYGEWWRCSQPVGRWFVSFRAGKSTLAFLQRFAQSNNIRFDKGPKDKLPLCGVCESEGERIWYAFWGKGDPRRVAAKLQRTLMVESCGN